MAFTRSNYSIASQDWKRDTYAVALVGPESVRHHDLVERSGYRVVMAEDGASASDLFAGEPVDVIVLDFALSGRPPEAVLLFSRRTSSAAPVIAFVAADKDDGYRRAFLAGARDVLPTPARGEDLLAAIDLVLEPRALGELVERLRGDEDDEGVTGVGGPQAAALTGEIERLRREHEERVRLLEDDLDSFRRQALDAVTERDRIIESRANARRRLAGVKKELKEREAHLAMTEQACEALQRKLKDARDHRRRLEARTKESELRAAQAQAASGDGTTNESAANGRSKSSIDRSINLAPGELLDALADGFVDPEEALMVRAVDERRLAELEDAYAKYQAGEKRIAELESQLQTASNDDSRGFDGGKTVADANALERQEELEAALQQRQKLESKVSDLEGALSAQADAGQRIAELESQLKASEELSRQLDDAMTDDEATQLARAELEREQESHAESRGRLDAVLQERDALKRHVRNAEREVADALTRLDELDPLVAEVEQVRHELHAERLRHMATRRLFEHVSSESVEASASASDHSPVAAELLRAQQEEERLERLFEQEKRSHVESKKELEHARKQIERVQSERDQMRVTVAALASDVAREASAEFIRPPSRAGAQTPAPVPVSANESPDAPPVTPKLDDTSSAKLP